MLELGSAPVPREIMQTETQDLVVIHCVVKHGSYAKAAVELGLSPSAISKTITRLEERLGARLLQRTTRQLSLTEAGLAFLDRTSEFLSELIEAENEIQKNTLRPQGNVKISAPVIFGQLLLAPLLAGARLLFPEIRIELKLTDRMVELQEDGIELAIRIGEPVGDSIDSRRLGTVRRLLVASPDYIEQHGAPTHPDELPEHECVLFSGFPIPSEWTLVGPSGLVTRPVAGRIATNNVEVLVLAAAQGLGLAMGATLAAEPYLLSRKLVRVMPDYEFVPRGIFAVIPQARRLSPKLRAVVEYLEANLGDPPPWDRKLFSKIENFAPLAPSQEGHAR